MTAKAKKAGTDLSETAINDFLVKNPDFFVGRDDLLLQMDLPHQQGGKTVSLIEKQVSLLRARNHQLKLELDEYVSVAKNNEVIFDKCKKLILSLIETTDSRTFFMALERSFRQDFSESQVWPPAAWTSRYR